MQQPKDGIVRVFVGFVRGGLRPPLSYLGTSPGMALHPRRFAEGIQNGGRSIEDAIRYYIGAVALGITIGWAASVEVSFLGIAGGALDALVLLVLVFGGSVISAVVLHWPLRWVGGRGPYEQAFKVVLYASGLLYPVGVLGFAVEQWSGTIALSLVVEMATLIYYAVMLSQTYQVGLGKIAGLFVAMAVVLGVPAAFVADRLTAPTQ